MTIKQAIATMLQRAGWELVRVNGTRHVRRQVSLGHDAFADIRTIYGRPVRTVFDVGANIGQTALRAVDAFPEATIYSFEPDPDTYRALVATARHLPKVWTHQLALGRAPAEATLHRYAYSETNSLLPKAAGAEAFVVDAGYYGEAGTTQIHVDTVDDFARTHEVSTLDVLKIDTQGYELEVLAGAERMLTSGRVPFIYLEVCRVRYYDGQPLAHEIEAYLTARGYQWVGDYESGRLTHYYHVGGNALYVHKDFGERRAAEHRLQLGRRLSVEW